MARKTKRQLQDELGAENDFLFLAHEKQKQPKKSKTKRKTATEICNYLNPAAKRNSVYIRSMGDWKAPSFNLKKQIKDFIRHSFVKYPVPSFMYYPMIDETALNVGVDEASRFVRRGPAPVGNPMGQHYHTFIEWFFILAQGGSFQKTVKHIMTKKEAHMFLSGPNHYLIQENIWWAKCKCMGASKETTDKLIDRMLRNVFPNSGNCKKYEDIIRFYCKYEVQITKDIFSEITDYIVNRIRHDREWTIQGRTLQSMIKASNEWHIVQTRAKLGKNLSWEPVGIEKWKFKDDEQKKLWTIWELTTNKELAHEGRSLNHCVYSYVTRCTNGLSFVFTLESTDQYGLNKAKHVTIEMNKNGQIVQVRGKHNRDMKPSEQNVVSKWAAHNGLTISRNRY